MVPDLAPDIDIESGSEDTFQSIVAKVTGNYVNYGLIDPAEVGLPPGKAPTIDYGRLMHVFPISAGIETTRHADAVNGIV